MSHPADTPKDWRELGHPELKDDYLGDGSRPCAPEHLPPLLARYFESKGQSRPMYTIKQIGRNIAWKVTCEVDACVCVAESYYRRSARWVCAAMIFKQLGVSNKDLLVLNRSQRKETPPPESENHEAAPYVPVIQSVLNTASSSTSQSDNFGFPMNSEQLTQFRKDNNIDQGTHHQVFHCLHRILKARGLDAPEYSIVQYVDCAESRTGDCGWWTVVCHAANLSYEAEGEARVLTKQLSAAGLLILLGVTKQVVHDANDRVNQLKRMRKAERQEEKRRRMSESLDASLERVEPYTLSKAEPFSFVKAEPFSFVKAEPMPYGWIKPEPESDLAQASLVPIVKNVYPPINQEDIINTSDLPSDTTLNEGQDNYSYYRIHDSVSIKHEPS